MATRKKAEPAEETPLASGEVCTNCGNPAAWRTKTRAASVAHYCDRCALAVYPGERETFLVAVE